MGADGHVGSLYPGQPATLATGDKLVVPQVKADGSASITMTAALMSSTAKAVICMTGSKKAAAVRMALEEQNLEVRTCCANVLCVRAVCMCMCCACVQYLACV